MIHRLLAIVMLFALVGCRAYKEPAVMTVPIENSTSERTVHTIRIDTITTTLPRQIIEYIVHADSSHIETEYASSDAFITPDGLLHHHLRNKSTPVKVAAPSSTDTIYREKIKEVPAPYPVEVEVERELTWWEKVRLDSWWWLVTFSALSVIWCFRSPIIRILRHILG